MAAEAHPGQPHRHCHGLPGYSISHVASSKVIRCGSARKIAVRWLGRCDPGKRCFLRPSGRLWICQGSRDIYCKRRVGGVVVTFRWQALT